MAASSQQAKFQIGDSRWLVEYVPEDITAEKALLAEEIAKATALLGDADVENNEDAKALKAAIDEAQGVYDNADATLEDVEKALEDLKAAEETYKLTLSISGVDAAAADDAAWYTLQGVRVAAPQKGIFIHNGKKVVLK